MRVCVCVCMCVCVYIYIYISMQVDRVVSHSGADVLYESSFWGISEARRLAQGFRRLSASGPSSLENG